MKLSAEDIRRQLTELSKAPWAFWGLWYGAVFLVFLGVFIPLNSSSARLAETHKIKARHIDESKRSGVALFNPTEMASMLERADQFEKGLAPASKSALMMAYVSEVASANQLKLNKITAAAAVPAMGLDSAELTLAGNKLFQVPVDIEFEADYATCARFFNQLIEDSKYSVVVDSYTLRQKMPPGERIVCEMTVHFIAMASA